MEYKLFEEFITLQALLKDLGIIHFNGELENRRGKKIRIGDSIEIPDLKTQIILVKPTSEELEEFRLEKLEKERVAKLVKEMNKKVQKKPTKKAQATKTLPTPRFPCS